MRIFLFLEIFCTTQCTTQENFKVAWEKKNFAWFTFTTNYPKDIKEDRIVNKKMSNNRIKFLKMIFMKVNYLVFLIIYWATCFDNTLKESNLIFSIILAKLYFKRYCSSKIVHTPQFFSAFWANRTIIW